jgi:hypothetical protein
MWVVFRGPISTLLLHASEGNMGMVVMYGQICDSSYPSFETNGHSKHHTVKRLTTRKHFLTIYLTSRTTKSEYIRVFFREWCYILQARHLDDKLLLKKVV